MKYFENCKSIEELKKEYRRLVVQNHPDNGGSLEVMKTINAEYEKAFDRLKDIHNEAAKAEGKKEMHETSGQFMEIINQIIFFEGITIELCGAWVWVSGNTKEYKEQFKALGFRWASKKKMWYWRNEEDATRSRGKYTMDQIRDKFGSETYQTKTAEQITA